MSLRNVFHQTISNLKPENCFFSAFPMRLLSSRTLISMTSRSKQLLLWPFFALLLATPFALKHLRKSSVESGDAPQAVGESLQRYGFHLTKSAHSIGVNFQHKAPTLDAKLSHIMMQVASMGAGVAVADFDGDGNNDFYVTNSGEGSRNALYRNKGDGSFEDVGEKMGVADLNESEGVSMGATWGDYDYDGFPDLLVYKWGRPQLWHNDGGKKFSRVMAATSLPKWANINTALWFDYDRDGKLDLFLGGYYPDNVDLWHLKNTHMMPDSFEYAQNGGRKYLLRNLGGGRFEDVTAQMGLTTTRWALAATASDLDDDGYPDLFVANDYGVSELFQNVGGKSFRDIGKSSGIGFAPKSGMSASPGDVFNSGQTAMYVSNISDQTGNLLQYNNLWVPTSAKGDNSDLHFDNLATSLGLGDGGWSFGAQFGDLNNDGSLDLYLTNGYVSDNKGSNYWYDYSKIAGGNGNIIADAAHWPAMKGRSLAGYQAKRVWIGDGAGKFREVAQAVGARDTFDGRAVALADLDNDGALDVIVSNQRGPLLVYKNTVSPDEKWIEFDLKGTQSNRDAIGASVTLFWNGTRQKQEVSGGSGFCAQNMRRLHFGLGKSPKLERAEIRWPSGKTQTLTTFKVGEINRIAEPA